MKGLKGVVVVSTIVAVAAVLGACEKEIHDQPLKFGGDVAAEKTAR